MKGRTEYPEKPGNESFRGSFTRLLSLFRPALAPLLLAALLLAVASVLAQAGPYFYKVAIDDYILIPSRQGLWKVALLYAVIVIFEGICRGGQIYIMNRTGHRLLKNVRVRLFGHLLRLPVSYFDRTPEGDIVSRMSIDMQALTQVLAAGIIAGAGEIAVLGGIAVMLCLLDFRLALPVLAIVPVLAVISELFRRRYRNNFRELRHLSGRLTSRILETFEGLATLRMFRMAGSMRDLFRTESRATRKRKDFHIRLDAVFYPVVELLNALLISFVLYKSTGGILSETMSFGVLVAFIAYIERFFHPVRELSALYSGIQSSLASADRIFELLDEPPEEEQDVFSIEEAGGAPGSRNRFENDRLLLLKPPAVEFRDIRFGYPGEPELLKGVSFKVAEGEKVALVGRTGEGKSSILHLLMRFYDDYDGLLLVGGRDARRIPINEMRRKVGVVLQNERPFRGTAREFLEGALPSQGSEIGDLLDRIGGPDARTEELSTGELQILSLIRLAGADPGIIVLDEATSSLDPISEEEVLGAAEKLFEGRTMVIAAHRVSSISGCDRILVLQDGEIIEEGDHTTLAAKDGCYSSLFKLERY